MELDAVVQPVNGIGFRASTGEPLPAEAQGASRDEALRKLRVVLEERVKAGAELVRLRVDGPRPAPTTPVWPDDAFTRDWLAGIDEVRRAADSAYEPWGDGPGPDAP
ncbi:MAG TPA: hypothetical protein VH120_03940 [Gemmataceae bacterium]|nr:hypothetical protein [Gemmataceae bacterium]